VQQRWSTFDEFRLFKPREREASFHWLVLGDAAKEVELLGEQLAEELRGALQLKLKPAKAKQAGGRGKKGKKKKRQQPAAAAWDMRVMLAALDAGVAAAEVLGANPSWLRAVGSKLAKDEEEEVGDGARIAFCSPLVGKGLSQEAARAQWHQHISAFLGKRDKLLPVLLDWVCGMSRLRGEGRAEGGSADVPLLVGLVEQLQEVWAGAGRGDGKRCCSHRLGSTGDYEPPFGRLCEESAAEVVQGVLASARAREAAGGEGAGAAAALMAPNPGNGSTPLWRASQNGHPAVVEALLGQEGIDVNQSLTDDGMPPLWIASMQGHAVVVEALLGQEGIDVNQAKTDSGMPPLWRASYKGHVAVVEALLGHRRGST
jgi:hypothetical protein